MLKWYEQNTTEQEVIISSRLRLSRNLKGYPFPEKLSNDDSSKLIEQMEGKILSLLDFEAEEYLSRSLYKMDEIDRLALKERRILNSGLVAKCQPTSLILSASESVSIVLNGDDHIRLQLLESGNHLKELWKQANQLDDSFNEQFEYAFDEKYGYLTAFPTNVGTAMRASLILHLPALSSGNKFGNLIGDMGRFGITVKGLLGEGSDNHGFLYEVANQKTLGQSEENIIDVVERVAVQLANQEKKIRKMSLKNHQLEQVDEVYKSYGVLKYARRLSLKESMIYLSHLMFGVTEKCIQFPEGYSIYKLMLGVLPANLQRLSDRPLDKEELDVARADYIRKELPKIL